MAKEMVKSFGAFNNIGDVVQINLPGDAAGVALRLYQEGLEIAEWAILDTSVPSVAAVSRFFLLTDNPMLPDNFVKWVGALLFGPTKTPCMVIEISAAPAEVTPVEAKLVPAL
jgi:hypothetical protein